MDTTWVGSSEATPNEESDSLEYGHYQYDPHTLLPPTGYEGQHARRFSMESDSSGSLHGYYDRIVQKDETLFFIV